MIILDSSFIIAYKVEDDEHHGKALKIAKEIATGKFGYPVISDYIFDESVTVVYKKIQGLKVAIDLGNDLIREIEMLTIDGELFEQSWQIFKQQKDTKFSFTDCTILALMKKKEIKNITTFDKDFEKIKEINVIH